MSQGGLEWEEVGPSSSSSSSQPHHGQRDWELLDDYDCSIFPPSSHEGLLPSGVQPQDPSVVDRGDSEELSLRRQSPLNSRLLEFVRCRLELGFQLLYSKLLLFLRHPFPSAVFLRRPFLSAAVLPSAAAAAALLGVLFFVRRRRRLLRLPSGTENESLLRLVREHDEKIAQLMHQVAEMNKALSASRRVPHLRIA